MRTIPTIRSVVIRNGRERARYESRQSNGTEFRGVGIHFSSRSDSREKNEKEKERERERKRKRFSSKTRRTRVDNWFRNAGQISRRRLNFQLTKHTRGGESFPLGRCLHRVGAVQSRDQFPLSRRETLPVDAFSIESSSSSSARWEVAVQEKKRKKFRRCVFFELSSRPFLPRRHPSRNLLLPSCPRSSFYPPPRERVRTSSPTKSRQFFSPIRSVRSRVISSRNNDAVRRL